MFYTDARVDLAIYDFESGIPIYFATDLKTAEFNSPNKSIPLKDAKSAPHLLINKPQINTFSAEINGLDDFTLSKLIPLSLATSEKVFSDFKMGLDNVPIDLTGLIGEPTVFVFDLNENPILTRNYKIENNKLIFDFPTSKKVAVCGNFQKPNRIYTLIENPTVSKFFKLQIKQKIKNSDTTKQTITITIPKTSIVGGTDFFLGNLGRVKNSIPLTFAVLHDCDEPTTFRFWEE